MTEAAQEVQEIENIPNQDIQTQEAHQDEQPAQEQTNYEEIARARGWKPKEEYKGDPNNWAPADEYVKLTEDNVVFQRRAVDNLTKQVAELTNGFKQQTEMAEREKRMAAERAYTQAISDMEARLGTAIQEGDTAAAQNAMRIRDQMKEDYIKAQYANRQVEDPQIATIRDNWRKENSWYDSNPLLNDWATKQAQLLASQNVPPAEQLQRISETVKQTFPHLFVNPNRNNAPVMPANNTPKQPVARETGEPRYDNLTAQGKRDCDDWVRAAKYSFNGMSEDALRKRWVGTADKESFKN